MHVLITIEIREAIALPYIPYFGTRTAAATILDRFAVIDAIKILLEVRV